MIAPKLRAWVACLLVGALFLGAFPAGAAQNIRAVTGSNAALPAGIPAVPPLSPATDQPLEPGALASGLLASPSPLAPGALPAADAVAAAAVPAAPLHQAVADPSANGAARLPSANGAPSANGVHAGPALAPPAAGVPAQAPEAADGAGTAVPAVEPDPALAERVWTHADERGFVRGRSAEAAVAGADSRALSGLSPAPPSAEPPDASAVPSAAAPRAGAGILVGFLASLSAAQLWVEGSMLVIPQLAKSFYESFHSVSLTAILSFIGLTIGSFVGGPAVDRFGIRNVYVATMAARVAAGIALWHLFVTGALGLPALIALVTLEFFFLGVSRVSELSLPATLKASAGASVVGRLGNWRQMIIEVFGIGGPLAAAALIAASGGFGSVLLILPVLMAVGAVLAALLMRGIPKAVVKIKKLGSIGSAWKALRSSPHLRRVVVGQTVASMLTSFLYLILAPAFGLYAAGTREGATEVAAWIFALFSAGGLAATFFSEWRSRRIERATAHLPEARREAARNRAFLRDTALWSLAAAAAFLGLWAMVFSGTVAGVLPIYVIMVPLGFAATGVLVPMMSLVGLRAPEESRSSVIGLVQMSVQAATALGFIALGWLFSAFALTTGGVAIPGVAAFIGVGLLATAASLIWLRIAARLDPTSRKSFASPPGAEKAALAALRRALPSYRTRRAWRAVHPDRPTVALLGAPSPEALAALRAGAGQSPGDVHLALDPSWFFQEVAPDGENRLFLRKGLVFDPDGSPVVVTYRRPRLVRHFQDLRDGESGPAVAEGARVSRSPAVRSAVLGAALALFSSPVVGGRVYAAVDAPAAQVGHMLQQARRDALRGKRVLVVWSGFPDKHLVFQRAKELGVEVTLADDTGSVPADLVARTLPFDIDASDSELEQAARRIRAAGAEAGGFDGIATFWEDSVLAAAKLGEALGLRYHSVAAAAAARSKFATQAKLKRPIRSRVLRGPEDLEAALEAGFPFPAVLKPEVGIEAMSSMKVSTPEEARAVYKRLRKEISPATDSIFRQGTNIVLAEYLDGDEYDVDLVMQGGRFVFESTTDNKPTDEPYFVPKGVTLPSRASPERQRARIEAAKADALALGFTDGLLHIEGKDTTRDGPRNFEVNPRMVGRWGHDWIKEVWGVDLVEEQLLLAAGIPAGPFKPSQPLAYLDGDFIIPARSGVFAGWTGAETVAAMPGFYQLIAFKEPGQVIRVPPQGYQRAGMVSSRSASAAQAETDLAAMRAKLGVEIQEAPVRVASLSEADADDAAALKAQILEYSREAGWEKWLADIEDYLAGDARRVFLAFDLAGRLVGFSITDEAEMPGDEYSAFSFVRSDLRGGGVFKRLSLHIARQAKAWGKRRYARHTRVGSQQHGAILALKRYLHLAEETEVDPFADGDRRVLISFDLDHPDNELPAQ